MFIILGATCVTANAAMGKRWESLLENNPFVPYAPPPPPPPEPPTPYEFRGRSVENGVEYFSLYNQETKKAEWVSRTSRDLNVKSYSVAAGLVLTDQAGRTIRLALKAAQPMQGSPTMHPVATLAAAASKPAAPPAVDSADPGRLRQVAAELQARRQLRQRVALTRG